MGCAIRRVTSGLDREEGDLLDFAVGTDVLFTAREGEGKERGVEWRAAHAAGEEGRVAGLTR